MSSSWKENGKVIIESERVDFRRDAHKWYTYFLFRFFALFLRIFTFLRASRYSWATWKQIKPFQLFEILFHLLARVYTLFCTKLSAASGRISVLDQGIGTEQPMLRGDQLRAISGQHSAFSQHPESSFRMLSPSLPFFEPGREIRFKECLWKTAWFQ